jgi:hypothetical protein
MLYGLNRFCYCFDLNPRYSYVLYTSTNIIPFYTNLPGDGSLLPILVGRYLKSFIRLSYDRSVAFFKGSSPQSAIWHLLFQFPVSFLSLTSFSSCLRLLLHVLPFFNSFSYISFNNVFYRAISV